MNVITLLALLPLLGAFWVRLSREPAAWTRIGTLFAAIHLAATVIFTLASGADSGLGWTLGINAALGLTIVVAQPLRNRARRDVFLPLLWCASNAAALTAEDARLLFAAWIAVPLCGWLALFGPSPRVSRARAVVFYYLVLGSLPLLGALGTYVYFATLAGVSDPYAIANFDAALLPASLHGVVFGAVALSAAVRLGVVPLHSWFPALTDSTNVGTALAFTGVQMAVQVLIRLALAPLPHAIAHELEWITALGLFATVYGAVLAICQHRLRRLVALVAVSQSGALLVGLSSANLISVSGALTSATSVALTAKCLLLVTAALETRVGIVDLRSLGGLAARTPRLAAAAILLALAASGIPGSLGFVGEDLLLQGILRTHPLVASLFLLAAALNAIALLRAMLRAFFGPPARWIQAVPDLFGREVCLVALAVFVVGLGLWPRPLIEAHQRDAHALVAAGESPENLVGNKDASRDPPDRRLLGRPALRGQSP